MFKSLRILLATLLLTTPALAQAPDAFARFDENGDGILEKSEVPRIGHRRFDQLDTDGDGRITQEEALAASVGPQSEGRFGNGAASAPDFADVRYSSNYDRSVMDIWTADGSTKAPVLVFFHGGGFVSGSKNVAAIGGKLTDLTNEGVAVVSVGYPFIEDVRGAGTQEKGLEKIYGETELAIAYLRENASRFKIDPDRIIVSGSSAGAMITTYLAVTDPQPGVVGGLVLNQPRGAERVLPEVDRNSVPIVLFSVYGPDNKMHPPSEAQKIYDQCEAVSANCAIFGSPVSGLPQLSDGTEITTYAIDFILN
ncbi:MAG: alpha/beta hydrolase fold domain-containing protein [Pseudomonadota bacterium]